MKFKENNELALAELLIVSQLTANLQSIREKESAEAGVGLKGVVKQKQNLKTLTSRINSLIETFEEKREKKEK